MHANSYFEELKFIRDAIPSWSERMELFLATIAFHLNNGLRRRDSGRHGLDLKVLINGEPCALHIRPNRGDLFIFYEVLARQAYDISPSWLDADKVRVILDCGANVGFTALYLAQKYKNARIVCVEPDPDNFQLLQKNVAGHERIEPLWAAVVGKNGAVHLTRDRPAYGNKVQDVLVEGSTIEVPGLTIMEICNQKEISRINFLKVDIEGAEKDVFSDAAFLSLVDLIAIELHAPYSLEEFRRAIAPYGFQAEPPGPNNCRHAHLAFSNVLE